MRSFLLATAALGLSCAFVGCDTPTEPAKPVNPPAAPGPMEPGKPDEGKMAPAPAPEKPAMAPEKPAEPPK